MIRRPSRRRSTVPVAETRGSEDVQVRQDVLLLSEPRDRALTMFFQPANAKRQTLTGVYSDRKGGPFWIVGKAGGPRPADDHVLPKNSELAH